MATYTNNPKNLTESGILIAVQLAPPEASSSGIAPIDAVAEINTSAMHTYIQEGVATSLGLQPLGPVEVTAPTRLVFESYKYRIRLLFPGGNCVETSAIEVPYMIHSSKRIKCMIGRDILQFCVMIYNGRTNVVTLDLQTGS